MASFANLSANLRLNISDFSAKLNHASAQVAAFGNKLSGKTVSAIAEVNNETRKWGLNLKSVSQVVSGILISQAFYQTLQNIRACTNAVWEFSQELENAQIAYSNLFGDSSLSTEFINVLKDYAAETPFAFTDAEAASRRLMAYGIKSENLMYVMQGIMSTATAQGDSTKIEPLSRAVGQIYTYGKLMTSEVRQLTEAGVPAYEILAEKLGLTQEQLANLGDQAIPASEAINALIDGMTERFGGLTVAASKTITGIVSNIKDNATMLGAGLAEPIVKQIKSVLVYLGDVLFELRDLYETSGIGGVFERVFPPESHAMLRQFAAAFLVLNQAIMRLISTLIQALGPVLNALIMMFNTLSPLVAFLAMALSALIEVILNNATAVKVLTAMLAAAATMWVVFKVRALAAAAVAGVVTLLSKAIAGLSIVMNAIVTHPFWAMLILLVGVVAGLSVGFGSLSDKISSFYKKLMSFQGVDADKLLLPSQEDRANDLDKFNNKLEGTSDAMDDLADSTGKATKAAKGLLSFDEVFKLNEPDEGTGKGIDTDLDLGLGDLGDWGGDTIMPDVPDFTGFAENYVTKLIAALKDKLLSAGLGAIIGGVLGGILGGPLGAKIGAIVGAIAGWFWSDLAEALNLTDVGTIAMPIATGLGAIIGALIGGPFGAIIGGAIGTLVGWLIDSVARGFETGDWSNVGYPLAIGLGAVIGGIAGGPFGAIIGAAIGGLIGWIIDDGFANGDWDFETISTIMGAGIGGAIGFIVGGPAGALIGTAIGGLVGWIVGSIIDVFEAADWDFDNIVEAFKLWGIDIGKAVLKGLFSTDGILGWSVELVKTAGQFFSDAAAAFKEGDWASLGFNVLMGIITGLLGAVSAIPGAIQNVFKAIWDGFCAILGIHSPATAMMPIGSNLLLGVLEGILGALGAVLSGIAKVCGQILSAFTNWFASIGSSIGSFVTDTASKIGSWASNLWSTVSNAMTNFGSAIANGMSSALSSITSFCANALSSIAGWAKDFGSYVTGAISSAADKAGDFIDDVGEGISSGVSSVKSGAKSAWKYATGWIGHADGGVFNREHIASFAEGNKAEAIIPLEESSAMQPFVDAVANGLTSSLAPIIANINNNSQQLQPLYVGTLIADDRSLKELERKMEVIRVQEGRR